MVSRNNVVDKLDDRVAALVCGESIVVDACFRDKTSAEVELLAVTRLNIYWSDVTLVDCKFKLVYGVMSEDSH